MDTGNLGILAGIIISLGFFAMVFAIFYLYKREKMAMIERGMDPRSYKAQPAPYKNLTWAVILIGSGIGVLLSFILDRTLFADNGRGAVFLYISLVAIFGGLGLFLSYRIEKREILDKE